MNDYGTKSLGTHAIFDLVYDVGNKHLLNSTVFLNSMLDACGEAGATVLQVSDHKFGDEGGFTYLVLLAESHASVHTWPEMGVAMFDVFTCGKVSAFELMDIFLKKLDNHQAKPEKCFQSKLFRGFHTNDTSKLYKGPYDG